MTLSDLTNGAFEAIGGLLVINHCRAVLRDKAVAGVSIFSTLVFTLWGVWTSIIIRILINGRVLPADW